MHYLLLLGLLTTAVAIHFHTFQPSEIEDFTTQYSTCLKSAQINASYALMAAMGIMKDEPPLKAFLFCLNVQNNIQNADGTFNIPQLRDRMSGTLLGTTTVDAIISECVPGELQDPHEAAFKFLKCSYKFLNKS